MSGPTVRAPLTAPNTINKFLVGARAGADQVVILNLPLQARAQLQLRTHDPNLDKADELPEWPAVGPLTPDEAINLAAWLVAVSGKKREFLELLAAVEKT